MIEHDGDDLRAVSRPQGSAGTRAAQHRGGILLNDRLAADGPTVLALRVFAEGIVSKKFSTGPDPTGDPQSRTIAAQRKLERLMPGHTTFSPNVLIATLSAIFQLRATFRPAECLIGHA